MTIFGSLKISLGALFTHKLRTGLALLGIVIGVAAVIVMEAVGRGAQQDVIGKIEKMGTNILAVNAGQVQIFAGRAHQVGALTNLSLKDVQAIRSECPSARLAAPIQSQQLAVKYRSVKTESRIVGTSPDIPQVRQFFVREGDFFTTAENLSCRRVAVLGQTVAATLFNDKHAIGEVIRINNVPFTVIGIMEAKGVDFDGVDQDDQVFIPINTVLQRLFHLIYINSILIQTTDRRALDRTAAEVSNLLRQRHRLLTRHMPDDFTIQNQNEVLQVQKHATSTFRRLTVTVAAISLLVGGIGILAVMLMAIHERINEIGLRRTLGARKKDILVQFLLESAMLSLGGGIVGMLLGVASSFAIASAADWQISLSLTTIFLAFVFAVVVGVFFGVYPARRAALLDPVVALRQE